MAIPLPKEPILNLGLPSPWLGASESLIHYSISAEGQKTLEVLSREERPRERTRRMGEIFRKLETQAAADVLVAAGRSSLAEETQGIRVLMAFLEVKRPGVEVLRQLEALSSLRRVWLKAFFSGWREPEESEDTGSILAISEVLDEASRAGILGPGVDELPPTPLTVRPVHSALQKWFQGVRHRLERGERIPELAIQFLIQLAMTEISLLEKRVSRVASIINPYDVRGMVRLLPILSRYDQDIEHMKSVISRLDTYKPFHERTLTMEQAVSSGEMDKLVTLLCCQEPTRSLGSMIAIMRYSPILDRRFVYLVSVVHQTAVLRADHLGLPRPDFHNTMLQVLEHGSLAEFRIGVEPQTAEAIWPVARNWGLLHPAPDLLEVPFRDDQASEFILPDGCPRLPQQPEAEAGPEMSLRQLLSAQINNDQFVLGILENQRAVAMPGIVELVAARSRSLRVLDKICSVRSLHTGLANKNVPAVMIQNPAPIPIRTLRRFIHVRFVTKVDLRQIARNPSGLRSDVYRELLSYLKTLEK